MVHTIRLLKLTYHLISGTVYVICSDVYMTCYITGYDSVGSTKLHNVMHRMGAQVHGLGANEPTCTPWQHHCITLLLHN